MPLPYGLIRRAGLGAHLAAIIVMAIIPTSILVVEFIDAKRRNAIAEAESKVTAMAQAAAARHRQQIEALGGMLRTAALVVADDDFRNDCPAGGGAFSTAVQLGHDGRLSCMPLDAAWLPAPTHLQPGPSDKIAIGYHAVDVGQVRGLRAVAHVIGADRRVHVVHAALSFDWASEIVAQTDVAHDTVISALHGPNGSLVARHHRDGGAGLAGLPADRLKALWAVMATDVTAAPVVTDVDGVERIFGRANVPETGIVFLVGVSREEVLSAAQRELVADLAMLGAGLALFALVVWFLLERGILRSIRQMRDAAVATANGELGKRITIAHGPAELRELGAAFNEMTERLERLAMHDALTGLANRRLLAARFEELIADGRPFAALEVDLDGFKPVNDTHGHAVGDRILADVARRIQEGLPTGAIAARIGGDEFLVLLPVDGTESLREKTIAFTEALLDRIAAPYPLRNGGSVSVGASIGIGFWPQNGRSAETLFRNVDEALYQAKRSGRNRGVYVVSPVSPVAAADDGEAAA
ncbi:diguanylate cyclase (GGDEF)-like protein [Tepidamorphus gemmatus]|uniref:Diguanylate cyclase (GGDEF)-like protein n=2 Tax=Tepidamorphus gemmatus TaxID=747076 RepID=A0A4R3MIZ1_9HYPH|nr:diguanylate cyclase (GGDEF)-like protein [Tepidamorphus gemmatus]